MNRYTLINPSDNIHFEAPDDLTAFYTVVVVGQGHYGAKLDPEIEGRPSIPICIFEGAAAGHLKKHFGITVKELKEQMETVDAGHRIVAVLRSFRIANGGKRSSLTDICGRAHKIADSMEAHMQADKVAA